MVLEKWFVQSKFTDLSHQLRELDFAFLRREMCYCSIKCYIVSLLHTTHSISEEDQILNF